MASLCGTVSVMGMFIFPDLKKIKKYAQAAGDSVQEDVPYVTDPVWQYGLDRFVYEPYEECYTDNKRPSCRPPPGTIGRPCTDPAQESIFQYVDPFYLDL